MAKVIFPTFLGTLRFYMATEHVKSVILWKSYIEIQCLVVEIKFNKLNNYDVVKNNQ